MRRLASLTSSEAFLCSVVCAAIFTDTFLYGVIVPILPFSLTTRANVPSDDTQSLTAVLLAAYGAGVFPTSLIVGYAIDRISCRRYVFFAGLFIIAIATLILELGSTIPLFFVGRILQGAAATIVWSSSLAWLLERVGHDEFPQRMGYAIMSQSLALAVSPPVGGFLFDLLGYDAVFIICLALILVVFGLSLLAPANSQVKSEDSAPAREPSYETTKSEISYTVRRVGSSSSLESQASEQTPLIRHLDDSNSTDITQPITPAIDQPINNHGSWWSTFYILTSPQIILDLCSLATVTFLWSAFAAILPLRMKTLFNSDAFGSGIVTLPLVIPTFLAPLTIKASNRFGAKWVAALLLGIRIPATSLLSLVDDNDTTNLVMFFILLTILGLALNPIIPLLTSSLLRAISKLESDHPDLFGSNGAAGRGFGFSNCAFACGAMVGPVASAYILERVGWAALCLILGGVNAAGFLMWLVVSVDSRKKRAYGDNGEGAAPH